MRPQHRRRHGPRRRLPRTAATAAALALLATGCAGAGGDRLRGGDAINVLMVNNPQMVELQKLTAEHFTKETGIKVNFTVLPENDVRDKISQDFSNQAGQYDVATISQLRGAVLRQERLADARWTTYVAEDPGFDQQDILPPMRESLTARGRQALRRAVLRRVVVPDVPQGRLRGEGPDHARPAHLAAGRRLAAKADGAAAGHEGHLPARPARLGRGHRPADHRRQHLRRHLVHQGLASRSSTRRSSRRRRSSTSTWCASTARPAPRSPASPSASTT